MTTLFSPLQLLSVALAGWMNRHQQAVIDYLLCTIHLATRRVCIAGMTTNPNGSFMIQVARQL